MKKTNLILPSYAYAKMMTGVILLFLSLGCAYVFFSQPIYETKAVLEKPGFSDVEMFNQGSTLPDLGDHFNHYTPTEIYELFIQNLTADSTKRQFFKTMALKAQGSKQQDQEFLYAQFSHRLFIERDLKGFATKISIKANTPEQSYQFLKQYLALANEKTLAELEGDRQALLSRLKNELSFQMDKAKKITTKLKYDRIVQLNEAIRLSQGAEIKKPLHTLKHDSASNLYLRGYDMLQEEKNLLLQRVSDDPFVPNLRSMESNYDLLTKLGAMSYKKAKLFYLDQPLHQASSPASPNLSFVLMLSLVLGVGFGLFFIPKRYLSGHHPKAAELLQDVPMTC